MSECFEIIDLTHPLSHAMPLWPGDPPLECTSWAEPGREGYSLRRFCCGEHSGTHLGTAAHFREGGLTVERLGPAELVRQAVVLHLHPPAGGGEPPADAVLTEADILGWEESHGLVPADSVVLLCTNWSRRWNVPGQYLNLDADGVPHFPGFSVEAVRLLVEERGVAGLGSDTPGIDAGADTEWRANRLLLDGRRFHLENLTNLDRLPAVGTLLVIGALPLVGGSGAPARVLGLVPAGGAREPFAW